MSKAKETKNPFASIAGTFATKGQMAPPPAPVQEAGVEPQPSPRRERLAPSQAGSGRDQVPAQAPARQTARPRSQPVAAFVVPEVPERQEAIHRTNIGIPGDVWTGVEAWLAEHPGHTLHSMVFCGLRAIGVAVADEHLTPKTRRSYQPGWTPKKG